MSLAEFWQQLESAAVPHVRERMRELDFELVGWGHGKWHAIRRPVALYRGMGGDDILRVTADSLIEAVEKRLADLKKWGDD